MSALQSHTEVQLRSTADSPITQKERGGVVINYMKVQRR